MKRKVFLVALVVALAMLLLFLAAPVMAAGSGEPSASGGVIPDTIMWALVVGFFMPLIIAVIQQRTWATWLRSVVAFVSCAAAAAITCVVRGDLATKTWISSALIVLVEAIATYELWWKKTGVAQKVEAVTTGILHLSSPTTPTTPTDTSKTPK